MRVLTAAAEDDRAAFDADYGDGGCCCFCVRAPCGWCTHPGNPLNQNECDECWEDEMDNQALQDSLFRNITGSAKAMELVALCVQAMRNGEYYNTSVNLGHTVKLPHLRELKEMARLAGGGHSALTEWADHPDERSNGRLQLRALWKRIYDHVTNQEDSNPMNDMNYLDLAGRVRASPNAMAYAGQLVQRTNAGRSVRCSWNSGWAPQHHRPAYERLRDLADYVDCSDVIQHWYDIGDDSSLRSFYLQIVASVWTTASVDASYFAQLYPAQANTTQPQPKEETPVKLFETKTLVKGVDIKTLSDDGLINTLKQLEAEKEDLTSVKVKSEKITARQAEIDTVIEVVVKELDGRK